MAATKNTTVSSGAQDNTGELTLLEHCRPFSRHRGKYAPRIGGFKENFESGLFHGPGTQGIGTWYRQVSASITRSRMIKFRPHDTGLYQTRGKWEFDYCCIGLYQAGQRSPAPPLAVRCPAHSTSNSSSRFPSLTHRGPPCRPLHSLSSLPALRKRAAHPYRRRRSPAPPLPCPAALPASRRMLVAASRSLPALPPGNGSHTMESNQKDERDEGQKEVSTSESGHEVRSSEQRGQDEFVISVSDENLHPVGSLGHHIRAAHIATRSHQAQMLPAKTAERDVGTSATGRYKLETSMYRVPEA
ncbi:hypothetical protein FB451DRAFT_1373152 [Mycena latifolia]|nr:hypothetical protein FB451DRAFT_1373152 [Mycena latifolia]